jgi:hypothetical protein
MLHSKPVRLLDGYADHSWWATCRRVGPSVARRTGWPARRAVATKLTRFLASSHDHPTPADAGPGPARPAPSSSLCADSLDTPGTFSGYRPRLYDGGGPSQLTREHGRTHARCNERTELAKTPPLFSLKCYFKLFSNIIECPKEPLRFECNLCKRECGARKTSPNARTL